jgi:hypothetical protein
VLTVPVLKASAEEAPTFERDVRPILKAYCLDCHGGSEKPKGGLDLRLKRFAVKGGKSGPAIVPSQPEESLLLDRVKDGEMPPGEKKLPAEQVAILERWVAAGAPTTRPEPETIPPGLGITAHERAYWLFQPVRRPEPPATRPEDRARTPIDALLLAKLQPAGLTFAPEADRRTLIRRLALDLTGLPPSPRDVEAFVRDDAPDAYERWVDRLLASPHYGERWARHWLDVAGYADSDGNGGDDTPRPYAYKYRDYVVRAFNADTPLDRFIIEQMAGDELVPRPWKGLTAEQVNVLAATGFLRTVADGTSTGSADLAAASNQVVGDTLKVVGSALLGLTVGCAQCHDHRYDPIPQTDYFRLRAVFEPALDPSHWRRPSQRLVSLMSDADRAKSNAIEAEAHEMRKALEAEVAKAVNAAFEKELTKFPETLRPKLRAARETPADKRTPEQKALLAANPSLALNEGVLYQYDPKAAERFKKERERIAAKQAEKPVEDFVSVTDEAPGVIPETHLFHRGDYRQPKEGVSPGDLTVAAPEGERFEVPGKSGTSPTSGRRLAYARHLVDGKHPLVGRVLVNRVWLNHFGRGLVETAGDFGKLGTPPTHPELLDWLADELVRQGWSLKRLHRVIVTSTAYRQSSRQNPSGVDNDAALYSHYPVRRLDAEAIRDRTLEAAGRLDRRLYGPPVPVAEDSVGQVLPAGDSPRRSLYVEVRRSRPVSLLAAFDAPLLASAVNCDRRTLSTTAPQALMLMNSDFVLSHAAALARRARAEAADGATPSRLERIAAAAWQIAYQRPITPEEAGWVAEFAAGPGGAPAPGSDQELAVLTNLCQQLLTSNEFLYVD